MGSYRFMAVKMSLLVTKTILERKGSAGHIAMCMTLLSQKNS